MGTVIVAGLLSGCGSSGDETKAAESTGVAADQTQASQTAQVEAAEGDSGSEEEIARAYTGLDCSPNRARMESGYDYGEETPGYDVVINKWNELHPNVHVELEAVPWENWQSSIQTAVLGGVESI